MTVERSRGPAKTSVAQRLLLGLVATVGLSSALVITLLALYEIRAANTEMNHGIASSVSAFAQMIEPALWDVDSARANRVAEAFARDPRIARLTVRDANSGKVMVFAPSATTDTALRVMEVRHGSAVLGDVSVAFDRQYYRRIIISQLLGAIGVSLIALVATLIAVRLLLRRILRRPLDELSVVVRRYGENSYQPEGLDLPYAEFDEIRGVLEAMSLQIRDHFRALGAANRELAAINRFLMTAAADIDPRTVVAEAARELDELFGATSVRAEVAAEQGGRQELIVNRAATATAAAAQVSLEVPVVVEGVRSGAILVARESTRPFTDSEVNLANALAAQVAAAVSRYRARSGERLLRSAIEQLRESVIITDADMRMVYVNPGFTAMTGYTSEESVGKVPRELKRASIADPRDNVVVAKVAAGETYVGRLRSRRKTGELFHEDTVITPVRDESGAITHHVSISRDVTQEMERDEHFRHAQRMDAVGQLAGGVAHDFNNMLAIVIIQLDLLERELQLTPDQVASMHNMREALDRAANLTRQLLMFSRRQAMRVQEHDLDSIVDQLLRILRRTIGEKIDVQFRRADAPVGFEGDAGMIEQVILNLCVNARDAMPNGGRLTISTGIDFFGDDAEHPGHWARLSVEDTGTGMSEEVRQRMFEPFFTTKDVGRGTGLGLATTHGIVAQHDGWIRIESEEGKGTTFHVYLPALLHSPAASDAVPARREREGGATVLVVEDEEVVRRIVTRSLRELGHRVFEAPSGPDAIRLCRKEGILGEIDLVLTDMVMPNDMSGTELIAELRKAAPGLRAIVMSGYSLQLAADVLPANIKLLSKPFSLDGLNTAIADALR